MSAVSSESIADRAAADEQRRRELAAALEITEYAEGPAGEAWALIASLFFLDGRPRFPAVAAEFDLSPPQAGVLRLLAVPRTMSELATGMSCDNSNVTGLVDRLEERGLVERRAAEHDRRVKLIAATPAGETVRERLNRRLAEPPEPLAGLSGEDLRTLSEIMRRALGR